ncbi:MAG: hypothetical protein ACKOXK_11415 [Chakrabartia sp.]
MNPFEMVVMIVAIVTIGRVIGGRTGKGPGRKAQAQMSEENQQLRDEVKGLKERIAVLERLATDTHSTAALDREIEKLR